MLAITSGGDFFAVKGVLEAALAELNPAAVLDVADFRHELLSDRAAELRIAGRHMGYLGEVSPAGLKQFELRGGSTVAELKVAALVEAAQLVRRYCADPGVPGHPQRYQPGDRRLDPLGADRRARAPYRRRAAGKRAVSRNLPQPATGRRRKEEGPLPSRLPQRGRGR